MTATPLLARRVLAMAAPLCVAVLSAGCGSTGSASPGATVTVTVAPSSTPASTPASPTPAPASSSAVPAGPPPCATRSLSVTLGLSQGAAGSIYQVIDFRNIGSVTCSLYGYPGVSLAGGSPVSVIGAPADEDPANTRVLVTLAPGAVANALLRLVQPGNFPPSKCHPVTASYLQVYPPNQTTPTFIGYDSPACSNAAVHTMTIDVIKPGSGS